MRFYLHRGILCRTLEVLAQRVESRLYQPNTGGSIMKGTKRPWYATGVHVQSAVLDEDNYICKAEGSTLEEAEANAQLIVRAVNCLEKIL